MNSHFENMSEKDMNEMHDHFTEKQSTMKPEAPIPVAFRKWAREEAMRLKVENDWLNYPGEYGAICMEAAYRHLSPQPSQGLREHAVAFADWSMQNDIVEGSTAEQIYDQFLKDTSEETPSAQPIEGEQKASQLAEEAAAISANSLSEILSRDIASEAHPIADSKEVPEEIRQWIEQEVQRQTIDFEKWHGVDQVIAPAFRIGANKLSVAMYHKMQEPIKELIDQTFEYNRLYVEKVNDLTAKETQIAGLLASNKEWGEKYEHACRERDDAQRQSAAYDALISELSEGAWHISDGLKEKADDLLRQYSSPTPKTDKP